MGVILMDYKCKKINENLTIKGGVENLTKIIGGKFLK